jgi:alkanesulfonate monooxygenase SsuD/methylene tetrahydromethanopterin reductase-like flavin-dependent oxidoreductase (luciferase family)
MPSDLDDDAWPGLHHRPQEESLRDESLCCGIYLPPFGPFGDPNVLVEVAVRAEAAGWDGIFLWDHVVTDAMPIADTWTTLGAIAQATTRIWLGPAVTPLARRRPWIVARQASAVSRLSRGRLIFGTGLGSDESGDFTSFGEPSNLRVRASRFTEGLALVRAIWAGEEIHHDGAHYQVELGATDPDPYPIPVWVASSTNHPQVIRRAAGCDGIFPNPGDHTLGPREIADLRVALEGAGLPAGCFFDVAVAGNASPAWREPMTVDLAGLAAAGMTWWMESLIHFDPLALSMEVVDAGPPPV